MKNDYRLKDCETWLYWNDQPTQLMATCPSSALAKYVKMCMDIADKMGFGDISHYLIKDIQDENDKEEESLRENIENSYSIGQNEEQNDLENLIIPMMKRNNYGTIDTNE